jgi:GNAT superfamily N-acetyltransferase
MLNNGKIPNTELIKNSSIVIGRIMSKEEFIAVCVLLEQCTIETSRYLKAKDLHSIAREFKGRYEKDDYEVFIAIDKNNDNRIVGFVTGEIIQPDYTVGKAFYVETLYVDREYRGSSAMVFLMRAIFKVADKLKLYSIVNVFPQDKSKLPTLAKRYADTDTADYVTYYRSPKTKKKG